MSDQLAAKLVGSWELLSRIDRNQAGEQREEPTLGSDPVAFLVFDKARFAAQFMKRARTGTEELPSGTSVGNNSRARGGYDAYFGTWSVLADGRTVRTRLVGALSLENVGAVFDRRMTVDGDTLVIELDTNTPRGEPVTRKLTWRRVG
ncbi:MAG TPA: lipocalin-like domain-containing protein [Casimicrobiaceae bacterium]|nr:lipocalin-like domain-containing protein [Casimicrobiaceae bacterium]